MSFLKNIFKKIAGNSEEALQDINASLQGEAKAISGSLRSARDDGASCKNEASYKNLDTSKFPKEPINNIFLENLEEELIRSDLGVELALDFVESIKTKKAVMQSEIPALLKDFLLNAFNLNLGGNLSNELFALKFNEKGPSIFLIVGVNGVGKTTSIGKLAHRLKKQGKKVLIAAGDTFRAAAEDQLKVWANRSGADYIQLEENAKSSAVVFKAIEKIKEEKHDVLIIDTAGRLQNKKNLMEELSKIKGVIDKNAEGCLTETMLVLDATTGQNALSQAKNFSEACRLSSIIVTKFDGTARAGMVFSIAHNLKLPVKLVGVGEGLEDLKDFNPDEFIAKYL